MDSIHTYNCIFFLELSTRNQWKKLPSLVKYHILDFKSAVEEIQSSLNTTITDLISITKREECHSLIKNNLLEKIQNKIDKMLMSAVSAVKSLYCAGFLPFVFNTKNKQRLGKGIISGCLMVMETVNAILKIISFGAVNRILTDQNGSVFEVSILFSDMTLLDIIQKIKRLEHFNSIDVIIQTRSDIKSMKKILKKQNKDVLSTICQNFCILCKIINTSTTFSEEKTERSKLIS